MPVNKQSPIPLDAATIVNTLIIGGIVFAIGSSIRTRQQIENGRPHIGLAMVFMGLTIIALHYLANLAIIYVLPNFMSLSDTWTLMRALRLYGYWIFIGTGLLCLTCGLHLVFRDLRSLVFRIHEIERRTEN